MEKNYALPAGLLRCPAADADRKRFSGPERITAFSPLSLKI